MYLVLDKVRKEFGDKVAVDDLSLEVPRGAIYGIIGPNGAGKTTTIRMIMNIIAPDSGRVLFENKEADSRFTDRVGYLPEERGLYKKMLVKDVMIYMAELKGKKASDVTPHIDRWLSRMELLDYKVRKVEDLSKGMAQKLQFLTTILHDPDVVILDELFSGLDPINMELMKDVLLELKRSGKTILFSTHVMEQAEKLCDYICMISSGRKVLDGKMADVKSRFGKNSIQVEIDGDGSFARTLPGVASMTEFSNYIELRLNQGTDPSLILKQIVDKVAVRRFEVMEPSLYDIFIDTAKVTRTRLLGEEKGAANV
ncbi:MAG: ATP-binding cassette domain-containing protein [candidate division Zixibacteria bacterium]|jgi:ABC-2 type transport system ATP-binding protein|nr:ATP-binding cassette domain-containing protein [candidate division Zixibacteria bacterium]